MPGLRARLTYALTDLVHLGEDRLNRRLLPAALVPRDEVRWVRWTPRRATPVMSPLDRPRLVVFVTTYRRAEPYRRLMDQIAGQIDSSPVADSCAAVVLDDASPGPDYPAAHEAVAARWGERVRILRAEHNLGKAGYWQTVQRALDECRTIRPELMLFVQDDLELASGAIRDALAIWDDIADPRKAVLNLFAAAEDEPEGRWVHLPRRHVPGARHRETGWFDLAAFLAGPRFFEITRHEVFPVHASRWRARPAISTGVGRQLTRRIWNRGTVYQVVETLAYHGAESSQMNTAARAERPMDNRPRRG